MNDIDTQVYYGEPASSANSRGGRGGWPCAYMLLYESEELLKEFYSNNDVVRQSPKK